MSEDQAGRGSRMLTGFNHNFSYKGKVYHVQTEDGGKENPQIVTHIFIGGGILDTVRRSYADLLGAPDLAGAVRDLMKAQHLEEIRKIYSGAFDAGVAAKAGDD